MKIPKTSLIFILLVSSVWAEEPLSAIDWLKAPLPTIKVVPEQPVPSPRLPVANTALIPEVEVRPLDAPDPGAVGLLPQSTTGLPMSLWAGNDADTVINSLHHLPTTPLPALQALLYTLLLAEADPPSGDTFDSAFLQARVQALMKYGAVYQAYALLERAGTPGPHLFQQWLDVSLLLNEPDPACDALVAQPVLSSDYAAHIYCMARIGNWDAAVATYEDAVTLNLLSSDEEHLLALYLEPELIEDDQSRPDIKKLTPLLYRLWESAGQRIPATGLPLAYAVADLDDIAGWKAQIEAAERLARRGALGGNHLLGLYTYQKASASGGVWDRVRAIHRLDLSLKRQDPAGLSTTFPRTWEVMNKVGLSVVFADMFAERIAALDSDSDLSLRVGLLSPDYESWAARGKTAKRELAFASSVAAGVPDKTYAQNDLERAIVTAFSDEPVTGAFSGSLGQDILQTIKQLSDAGPNTDLVQRGLVKLRAFGLEDTARRTALQLLLLVPQE